MPDRKRTGLPSLVHEARKLAKLVAVWGIIIRLTIAEEDRPVYDTFVSALQALLTAIGELPEGD